MSALFDMAAFEERYGGLSEAELTAARNARTAELAAVRAAEGLIDTATFEVFLDRKIEVALLDKLLWKRRG